jgi:hypothetical protein
METLVAFGVGDVVRYRSGTALYLVTATPGADLVRLIDMGSGQHWGTVQGSLLVLVHRFSDL